MKNFLQKCITRLFLFMIRGYQLLISPLFPPACRFTPSCSQYAIDAIKCHGVFRGFLMAAWRILRCHPFSAGGYDPVK
jgi:putative membrane protein insertion efficiency factor